MIDFKERIARTLSIITFYSFLLIEIIPFSRAMNEINFTEKCGTDIYISKNLVFNEVFSSVEERVINETEILKQPTIDLTSVSLTNGPGQAESNGYTLNSTDGLVDKFTGDFHYSIPLMDVEGFPITISYNSNIGMTDEASWVGLGWNLNVGSIAREVRGLPDDFNGTELIQKTMSQKEQKVKGQKTGPFMSIGVETGIGYVGGDITFLSGSYYNDIVGSGLTYDISVSAQFSIGEPLVFNSNLGFGFSYDSKNGIGTNRSIGVGIGIKPDSYTNLGGVGATYGSSYHSRSGVTGRSLGMNITGGYLNSRNKFGGLASFGTSSRFTIGTMSEIPSVSYQTIGYRKDNNNIGVKAFVRTGVANLSTQVGYILRNYNYNTSLDYSSPSSKQYYYPAFGYLHSGKYYENGTDGLYPLMDFNRTNDMPYSEEMKNLPFSFQTYDILNVSSPFFSSTFRANRSDVGVFKDPIVKNTNEAQTNDFSAGLLNTPLGVELGYARGNMNGDVTSGEWVGYVDLKHEGESNKNEFDPSVYFKSIGETTPQDMSMLNLLGGTTNTSFKISPNSSTDDVDLTNTLSNNSSAVSSVINNANSEEVIGTFYNPIQANKLESNDSIISTYLDSISTTISRIDNVRKENHISKIEVLTQNGMQLIYGVPSYNKSNSSVNFSFDGTANIDDRIVKYDSGDNSTSNSNGRMAYFNKTETPGYAHSYLLTEAKSTDYIDVTGDGPSVDDIGSYYKVNYFRKYGLDTASTFKWRFPYTDATGRDAMYNPVFEGTELDDMASYSYGEKEIWYTHTVESKNFIAVFYLEEREDVFSVVNEDGYLDSNKPLMALDKIKLYNRDEWEQAIDSNSVQSLTPIQIVDFEYDYTLCPGTPSNINTYNGSQSQITTGKLTLLKIKVYSGKSYEGAYAEYSFEYGNNPSFNYANVDGWGNYKVDDPTKPNSIFPYSEQDKSIADSNSSAWKIVAINNPMGGRTEIDYEADRYVNVQDKRTMKHMAIEGMMDVFQLFDHQKHDSFNASTDLTNNFSTDYGGISGFVTYWVNKNYSVNEALVGAYLSGVLSKYTANYGALPFNYSPNNVLVFKLDQGISSSLSIADASDLFVKQYLDENGEGANGVLTELFIKAHVNIKSGVKDYVPLFAEIAPSMSDPIAGLFGDSVDLKNMGVLPIQSGSNSYEYGYVVLSPVNSGERERFISGKDKGEKGFMLHPIQRAALDYARQNLPDKVYGSCNGCDPDLSVDARALFGLDMHKYMITKGGYVPSLIDDYSVLRTYIADSVKLGGNARVKSITYKDNWAKQSKEGTVSEQGSAYTWNYRYPALRKTETGVASFEPQTIIDESDFYHWESYNNVNQRFPDESKFTPTPLAGALFPSPVVGYAEVQVSFSGGISGFSKIEYYTAKDKPTVEDADYVSHKEEGKWTPVGNKKVHAFSQGVYIETNDFHGKIKRNSLYSNDSTKISTSEYFYNKNNEVHTIDSKGEVREEQIATEYDIHVDNKLVTRETKSLTLGLNVTWYFPLTIYPFPVIGYSYDKSYFYSSNLIKHVNKSAVLDSVVTEYLGSKNIANNRMYDRKSGSVLLSSLIDEYNDTLNNFSYPSHWYYRELRNREASQGYSVNCSTSGGSVTLSQSEADYFSPGDYVIVSDGTTTDEANVLSIYSDNHLRLINLDGSIYDGVSGSVTITILKSGRSNRLRETIQTVVTKESIPVTVGSFSFPESNIISSSALTYKNKVNASCGVAPDSIRTNLEVQPGSTINPFDYGLLGDLVINTGLSWQSGRVNDSHIHGTRFDGTYSTYYPYYKLGTDTIWRKITEYGHPDYNAGSLQNWRESSKVVRYNGFGVPVETNNQLDVRSAVLYGYNNELNILPVASAQNAMVQQIAYDGFEDYNYLSSSSYGYSESHFDFKESLNTNILINDTIRHSGLKSLQINNGSNASIVKIIANQCTSESDVSEPKMDRTYYVDSCTCVKPFEPTPGKYLIGLWVKVGNNADSTDYSGAEAIVKFDDGSPQLEFQSSGPIIDGWQRLEGIFNIPDTIATEITISLHNNSGDVAYFDDLRIHPYLASMSTVAYDPVTLQPIATHDGYNFTTFYGYDENHSLVRVRVETEKGIQTISESEFGIKKIENSGSY